MRLQKIDDNKMKWVNIFFDTIYKYYCKGNNKVYQWELQRELKFLNYLKDCGEYNHDDADRLNSIKNLYQHIKNGTI
tara:strand:- start:2538 stop:2768 length:231 start_codon:yes stop_codon:yes gene_type:complete